MLCSIASNYSEPPTWHQVLFGVAAVVGAAAAVAADAAASQKKLALSFSLMPLRSGLGHALKKTKW